MSLAGTLKVPPWATCVANARRAFDGSSGAMADGEQFNASAPVANERAVAVGDFMMN